MNENRIGFKKNDIYHDSQAPGKGGTVTVNGTKYTFKGDGNKNNADLAIQKFLNRSSLPRDSSTIYINEYSFTKTEDFKLEDLFQIAKNKLDSTTYTFVKFNIKEDSYFNLEVKLNETGKIFFIPFPNYLGTSDFKSLIKIINIKDIKLVENKVGKVKGLRFKDDNIKINIPLNLRNIQTIHNDLEKFIWCDLKKSQSSRKRSQSNIEIIGTLTEPIIRYKYSFWNKFEQIFEIPLNKFNNFVFLCERSEKIPENQRSICLTAIGNNIHAVLIALFMDESFREAIHNKIEKNLCLQNIFETLGMPPKTLMQDSETYLIKLGTILNQIMQQDPNLAKKSFKFIENILSGIMNEGIETNLLSMRKITFELIKNQYNSEFNIPHAEWEKLPIMLLMTSLNESQRIECIELLLKQINEQKTKNFDDLFTLLAYLPEKNRIEIINQMIRDPEKFKMTMGSYLSFEKVRIGIGQSVTTNAAQLISNFISLLPMNHLKQKTELSSQIFDAIEMAQSPAVIAEKTKELIVNEKDQIFGRTILKDKQHAYKILKKGETLDSFRKEQEILKVLRLSKNQFQSVLPDPKNIVNRPIDLKGRVTLKVAEEPAIFKFKTTPEYYDYLQNISGEEDYQKGREKWLNDSLKLLRNGWFHESTPMYHNQEQNRPYIVLAKLLHANSFAPAAGRLDTPRLYNQHPNVGATGIRDVGDLRNVSAIAKHPTLFSNDLNRQGLFPDFYRHMEIRKSLLTANFIATHRLVDTLLLAMRLEKDASFNWDWRNTNSRKYFAEQGIRGMALTLAAYSGKDYEECYSLAKDKIDWDQWSKEILFWWTPDQPDSYSDYIDNGALPEKFYPNGAEIKLPKDDNSSAENYIKGFGFGSRDHLMKIIQERQKGNPFFTRKDLRKDPEAKLYLDLGTYNSSLLLHTLELDAHLTAALAMCFAESNEEVGLK